MKNQKIKTHQGKLMRKSDVNTYLCNSSLHGLDLSINSKLDKIFRGLVSSCQLFLRTCIIIFCGRFLLLFKFLLLSFVFIYSAAVATLFLEY